VGSWKPWTIAHLKRKLPQARGATSPEPNGSEFAFQLIDLRLPNGIPSRKSLKEMWQEGLDRGRGRSLEEGFRDDSPILVIDASPRERAPVDCIPTI